MIEWNRFLHSEKVIGENTMINFEPLAAQARDLREVALKRYGLSVFTERIFESFELYIGH